MNAVAGCTRPERNWAPGNLVDVVIQLDGTVLVRPLVAEERLDYREPAAVSSRWALKAPGAGPVSYE